MNHGQKVEWRVGRRLGLALVVCCMSCEQKSPSTHEFGADDDESVRSVLETQRAAWNRGDIEGFLSGYEQSEELVFTSGANIRRGFAETRTKFRAKYGDDPSTMGTLDFDLIDVRGVGADGAVVLGHWELTETPQVGEGIFSVILERQGGTWRIIHDHTSASAKKDRDEADGGVRGAPRPKEAVEPQQVGVDHVKEDRHANEGEGEGR